MKEQNSITLQLGILTDTTLADQLTPFNIPKNRCKMLGKLNDGINNCMIHGILTASEGEKARNRLIKYIVKEINNSKS